MVADEQAAHQQVGVINSQLNIDCGQGSLKILELKPHGGKQMDFKSFLNGRQAVREIISFRRNKIKMYNM
jgi:methionyl-tRNA formyltransferase